MILSRETILHPEFIKKYFSHPRYLVTILKDVVKRAEDDMEDGLGTEWKHDLAKVHCMLKDYFKTEGVDPETYLLELNRRRSND